jgi:hypothetical protein
MFCFFFPLSDSLSDGKEISQVAVETLRVICERFPISSSQSRAVQFLIKLTATFLPVREVSHTVQVLMDP